MFFWGLSFAPSSFEIDSLPVPFTAINGMLAAER